MSAQYIVASAVIAGIFMYIVSELGYRLGISRSNLALIDGEFAVRSARMQANTFLAYLLGIPIHLVTSAVFGVIYYGIVRGLDVNAASAQVLSPYVFCLYLAMLVTALPIAGQGILGRRLSSYAWLEQLAFHAVFGVGLWWSLETL